MRRRPAVLVRSVDGITVPPELLDRFHPAWCADRPSAQDLADLAAHVSHNPGDTMDDALKLWRHCRRHRRYREAFAEWVRDNALTDERGWQDWRRIGPILAAARKEQS